LLELAIDHNRFVPFFLLGNKILPKTVPTYIGFGDENEPVEYAFGSFTIWHKDNAALEGLQKFMTKQHLSTNSQ
jgi:hypothetical protein